MSMTWKNNQQGSINEKNERRSLFDMEMCRKEKKSRNENKNNRVFTINVNMNLP